MAEVKTLTSWDTQFSADSVEWCPVAPWKHVFVCGTYQLMQGEEQTATKRLGRLHLLALTHCDQVMERLQTVEVPAVLDCKWASQRIQQRTLLGVATAAGELCVFKLQSDQLGEIVSNLELVEEAKVILEKNVEEAELLALSLDWSITAESVRIATSDSRGRISVFRLDDIDLKLEHNWTAHGFEAWTVHFDLFNHQICYTGGDDCKLRVYDLRSDLDTAQLTNTAHSAGVTSLSCRHNREHVLLSGSYDEQVRLWDTRQMKRPVNSASTGGGVWRLRWRPGTEELILAACMYKGFCLLDQSLVVVAEYLEHESIAYGADWTYLTPSEQFAELITEDTTLMATCSFYDHKLFVSSVIKK